MNTALPEMLHYLNSKSEQSGQHPPLTYFNGEEQLTFLGLNCDQGLCELVVNGAMKTDPGIGNGWNDDSRRLLNYGNGCSEFEMSSTLPRTGSCPPNAAAGKQSCKKRKADKTQNLKVEEEEKSKEKKKKGCVAEAEQNSICKSTITTVSTNKRGSSANAKQSSKVNEAPRTDYIHVRARRGQATDSHSLAPGFGSGVQQGNREGRNAR